ncbi:MAG: oxaloacetate decarboxylase [Haloferacaceae archaeon]
MTTTDTLRDAILDDDLHVTPGVFDALSATIAEREGFDSVYLGGYATGAATAATEPMLTLTEMCDRAREITHATDLPLAVDGGAGYGHPAHTYRAVREFAKTGVSAVHIEDQVYPKRLHYHEGVKHIVPTEEMVAKVEAAAEAVESMPEDVVVVARTDAGRGQRRETEDEDVGDVLERVQAYLDAGAEVAMVFPRSMEELRYVVDGASGPVMFPVIEGYTPYPTTEELDEAGVDWAVYPITPTVAATRALVDSYRSIRDAGVTGVDPHRFEDVRGYIEECIDLPTYYDIEERAGYKGYEGTPDTKQ